jgi:hypothetical protein
MTYQAIVRVLVAMVCGVALLAALMTLLPAPFQILALLIGLPLQSLLVALATSRRHSRMMASRRSS